MTWTVSVDAMDLPQAELSEDGGHSDDDSDDDGDAAEQEKLLVRPHHITSHHAQDITTRARQAPLSMAWDAPPYMTCVMRSPSQAMRCLILLVDCL